jgi:hypothetical protein
MSIATPDSLSLAAESWERVSIDSVYLSFLRGEWDKEVHAGLWTDRTLVSQPDLTNCQQNQLRAQLLFRTRGGLLGGIPRDTSWFAVKYLRPRHFGQLHAIRCEGWTDPGDRNELVKVAARMPFELRTGSTNDWEPILWGHSLEGPFSILEANHRLTALAGRPEIQDVAMLCYIGISAQQCVWHGPDWP